MKITSIISLAATAQCISAHYIWNTLIANLTASNNAVRVPVSNFPVKNVTSKDITCNVNTTQATALLPVSAGSVIGFDLDDIIFHQGPAAIYLGKAPTTVVAWDGSGDHWFKIAEWGATFDPFNFVVYNATQLTTTIPADTPNGEYLVRIEQIGLHLIDSPEWYISCAQINITNGGTGIPDMVSIPGYVSPTDPGITVNIYEPVPTSYTVPGPAVWRG